MMSQKRGEEKENLRKKKKKEKKEFEICCENRVMLDRCEAIQDHCGTPGRNPHF